MSSIMGPPFGTYTSGVFINIYMRHRKNKPTELWLLCIMNKQTNKNHKKKKINNIIISDLCVTNDKRVLNIAKSIMFLCIKIKVCFCFSFFISFCVVLCFGSVMSLNMMKIILSILLFFPIFYFIAHWIWAWWKIFIFEFSFVPVEMSVLFANQMNDRLPFTIDFT